MKDPLPLWMESIPDREPWRRGRDAIAFISLFILLGQAGLIAWSIVLGNLTTFLLVTVLGLVAIFLLYFIWIGHNWTRWLVAPLYAVSGFANAIWGMIYGNGPLFLLGLAGLGIFTYLALAPSVYAFARRQRELIQLRESVILAGAYSSSSSVSVAAFTAFTFTIPISRRRRQTLPKPPSTRSSSITTTNFFRPI